MDTEGVIEPESREAARERYERLEPAASEVVRAVTREMGFDHDEYERRVTDTVRETARKAMFASLLAVRVGSREEYERWRDTHDGEVVEAGTERADRVVWHGPPWAETAVAATFQSEREAAVATLRRQALGHVYSEVLG